MANLAQMNTVFASQGGKKRPSASPQASGSNSPKGMKMDSGNVLPLMMPVACPECHLDFPGVEALQAHISVTHKHLDVELPRDLQATFSERAKSVLQQNFKCELCQQGFKTEGNDLVLFIDYEHWIKYFFIKGINITKNEILF